jgi:hypothetical protein
MLAMLQPSPQKSPPAQPRSLNWSAGQSSMPLTSHQELYPASEWILGQRRPLDNAQHCHSEDSDGQHNSSSDDINVEEHDDSGIWQADFQDGRLRNRDAGILVALRARQDNQDLSLYSFTAVIDRPDMLATYTPSPQSTPLCDSMAAKIFCHFINVIGPCMSIFERCPANSLLIFQGLPIPRSQQHIWTCKYYCICISV